MKYKYLLLLITLLTSNNVIFAEYFRQIGLSEGLTQPSVMAIYQDKLGRMWLGTFGGLQKYDSKTRQYSWMQMLRNGDDLNHPSIFSLYQDLQGTTKVKVIKQEDGTVNYTKVLHTNYNIDDKMYFYPISNAELFKNHNLIQNPGWK